jgi:pyrroline-5-carboxylate reductase
MPVHSTTAHPRVAFLGGGNMARALVQGLLREGWPAGQLRVGEPLEPARAALASLGVAAGDDNAAAIAGARLVVLAVKPQQAAAVLGPLAPGLRASGAGLLSIAAGLQLAGLAQACPGVPVVRAMPNRPALLGLGAAALHAPPGLEPAVLALAERVLAASGRTVWVPRESDLDIVTALSGSGPAYFFQLAEHLAAAATAQGLEPDTAMQLAVATLQGAGALAAAGGSLAEERAAVTSKGGTTEAALAALAAGGFGSLVAQAIAAASYRSRELAAQMTGPPADEPASPVLAS